MKKIMGIDISSRNTGWCVISGNELIEYNTIHPSSKMTLGQKLNLFNVELEKAIRTHKPDIIAIEDVVICRSAKTAIILGRFNGVAIRLAYAYNSKEPFMYVPTTWKKDLLGCNGHSSKAEIQLSICEQFSLITSDRYDYYIAKINDAKMNVASIDNGEVVKLRNKLNSTKKKKVVEKSDLKMLEKEIGRKKKEYDVKLKDAKKQMDLELQSISLEIYSETGICEDIADSIGVALKCQIEHS